MLSQKARYALRALLHLARHDGPISVGTIADAERISRKFLEAILLELKSHGLVASRRGKFGGYALARPPGEISFAAILRAVDGPIAMYPCASRTAFRPCRDCRDPETCAIRAALLEARDASAAVLERRSLADAIAEAEVAAGSIN